MLLAPPTATATSRSNAAVIGVGTYAAKSPAAANQLCPLGTRTQGGL